METQVKPRDFRGISVFNKLLGKVRPTDAQGVDITEEVNHSARVTVAAWWDKVIGKVRLVDSEGKALDSVPVTFTPDRKVEFATPKAYTIGSTSGQILKANGDVCVREYWNVADETIWIMEGEAAVANAAIPIFAFAYYLQSLKEGNLWTGDIHAICASGAKILIVREGK